MSKDILEENSCSKILIRALFWQTRVVFKNKKCHTTIIDTLFSL